MATREYKVRVPREIPEATSETVSAWLDEAIEKGGHLAEDPGGGAVRVSISLDPEKVVEFANKRREKVNVALRRLIASHVKIEPVSDPEEKGSAAAEAKELLPERVLPRALAFDAEDFIDAVHAGDKGLALIYRRVHRIDDLAPAETPAEDRKLATALAEVCNRRSPAWMLANADLVKLMMTSFRWGIAQTEDLDSRVRQAKSKKGNTQSPIINLATDAAEATAPPPSPASTPGSAAPHPTIAIEEMQHLDLPVQQEGEF